MKLTVLDIWHIFYELFSEKENIKLILYKLVKLVTASGKSLKQATKYEPLLELYYTVPQKSPGINRSKARTKLSQQARPNTSYHCSLAPKTFEIYKFTRTYMLRLYDLEHFSQISLYTYRCNYLKTKWNENQEHK